MLSKKPYIHAAGWSLMALSIAWGLKYHYSIAEAEDLKWILAPTAALVEMLTGHGFYFATGTGYVSDALQIIIAPACAGVNFFITLFCTGFFCGIFRLSGWKHCLAWLTACTAGGYVATIMVNTVRIQVSIFLITAGIQAGWLTPQRIHRMGGIVIYFFFLILFYHIIQKIILRLPDVSRGDTVRIPKRNAGVYPIFSLVPFGILPLCCYWIITIAVPWINGAYGKNPAGFIEHILTVGVLSLGMIATLFLASVLQSLIRQIFVES